MLILVFLSTAGPSSLYAMHRSLFRGTTGPVRRRPQIHRQSPYSRLRAPQVWSHRFFCLSDRNCQTAPQTKRQKDALEACGLGEKVISIEMHSTAEELHQKITSTYPKLANCGGYELLRCYGNSRSLSLMEPPYTAARLCAAVAQSRIYIRPVQSSVQLNVENTSSNGVSMSCILNFVYSRTCLLHGW